MDKELQELLEPYRKQRVRSMRTMQVIIFLFLALFTIAGYFFKAQGMNLSLDGTLSFVIAILFLELGVWALNWRVKKGLFGNNESEVREISRFAKGERDKTEEKANQARERWKRGEISK